MADQVIHSLPSALNTKINDINDMLGTRFQVKAQYSGLFAGLIKTNQMWIIFVQRATEPNGGCWLIHRWNEGAPQVLEITKSNAITILTNDQGTVDIRYSDSTANILACAIRLY